MANQNIQDSFLNNARKERLPVTIYLTSGVKLLGRVRGFDKYCVVFESSHQEQLIFKHAISTVVTPRHGHNLHRSPERTESFQRAEPAQPEPPQPAEPPHPAEAPQAAEPAHPAAARQPAEAPQAAEPTHAEPGLPPGQPAAGAD